MREKEVKGTGDIPSAFSLRFFLLGAQKKEPKPGKGRETPFVLIA